VLYIKPANTFARDGEKIALPPKADTVEVYGTLGIVIGQSARRVNARDAMRAVRGYVVAADLTLPHESLYRPPIREKCFDGALPLGSGFVERNAIADPARLEVRISVNGMVMQRWPLARLARPIPRLIADISAFLTLEPGDILLAAAVAPAPRARLGDLIAVEIPGIGRIENRIGEAIP